MAKVLPKQEMMGEHTSYHQSISTDEAMRRLKLYNQNGYLTHYSKSHESYMLSVFCKQKPNDIISFGIVKSNGMHALKGREDEEYVSIDELLSHYESNRISPAFPNIGKAFIEKEYEKQQALIDERERHDKVEESKLLKAKKSLENRLKNLEEELQAMKEESQGKFQKLEEKRQKDLQEIEDEKQQELRAITEENQRKIQELEEKTQKDLQEAENWKHQELQAVEDIKKT